MKIDMREVLKVLISTLIVCGVTIIFTRGELLNKKAPYDYVDKKHAESIEYTDKEISKENINIDIRLKRIEAQNDQMILLLMQHIEAKK
jgi:hypothetical protein